jgi:methionine salvage enolase-phosphatase E1
MINRSCIFTFLFFLLIITCQANQTYYERIFQNETFYKHDKINLNKDNEELFLFTSGSIRANEAIISISNDSMLCGCQFFPYQHVLLKYIDEYYDNYPHEIPHFEEYMNTMILTYQLLYYTYVGIDDTYLPIVRRDVKTYDKIEESDYYKFTYEEKQIEFLNKIITIDDRGTNYTYDSNEKKIMNEINMEDSTMTLISDIYQYIKNRLIKIKSISKRRKDMIFSFMSNRRLFFRIYYYITKHSFSLKMSQYLQINKFNKREVESYSKVLKKQKTQIKRCLVLSPVLSTIRMDLNSDASKSQPSKFEFDVKDNTLMLISKNDLQEGEIKKEVILPNDRIMFDYGYTGETNYTMRKASLMIHRDYVGKDKRRKICQKTKCEGLLFEKPYYKGNFTLAKHMLNENLLNVGRLLSLNENNIVYKDAKKAFKKKMFISLTNEISALSYYYKMISDDTLKFPLIHGILRKENPEEITELISNYTNKEKDLLSLGFTNFDINMNHLAYALEKMEIYMFKTLYSNG